MEAQEQDLGDGCVADGHGGCHFRRVVTVDEGPEAQASLKSGWVDRWDQTNLVQGVIDDAVHIDKMTCQVNKITVLFLWNTVRCAL